MCREGFSSVQQHTIVLCFASFCVFRIMYEFLAVNTTMNKINNTGVCFTWFLLSLHVVGHTDMDPCQLVTQTFSNYSILFK
jgi:hypothetical protein